MPLQNRIFQPKASVPDRRLSSNPSGKFHRFICFFGSVCFSALLTGCTTYTWPDGSQKTVLGVPAEEENSRYEEDLQNGTQYKLPGEVPPKKEPQE